MLDQGGGVGRGGGLSKGEGVLLNNIPIHAQPCPPLLQAQHFLAWLVGLWCFGSDGTLYNDCVPSSGWPGLGCRGVAYFESTGALCVTWGGIGSGAAL